MTELIESAPRFHREEVSFYCNFSGLHFAVNFSDFFIHLRVGQKLLSDGNWCAKCGEIITD